MAPLTRSAFQSGDAGSIESSATLSAWLASTDPYRLPMIIGAKKGIPNFNEFVFQTTALAARKLELIRPNTNSPPTQTNDMFVLGISNFFAFEAWNSYSNTLSSNLPINDIWLSIGNVMFLAITNSDGLYYTNSFAFRTTSHKSVSAAIGASVSDPLARW